MSLHEPCDACLRAFDGDPQALTEGQPHREEVLLALSGVPDTPGWRALSNLCTPDFARRGHAAGQPPRGRGTPRSRVQPTPARGGRVGA